MNIAEQEHGTGLREDLHDGRDFPFGAYLESYEDKLGEIILDWNKGYNVEKDLGIVFPVKNQGVSGSCVGQSVAGYKEFIEYYLKRSTTEKSAKSIYSQIALPQSGAYFRDGMKVACEYGINTEKEVPSYIYSVPGDEAFMQDKRWMNKEMAELAARFSNQNFYSLKGYGIDVFAKAIIIGKGAVIGVVGTNNGTWTSKFPVPPAIGTPQAKLWGHALLAVGFLIINGKKYIKVRNSWGTIGENGYQYLGEEWFANYGLFIYNPWVIASKLMFTQKDLKHATAYTIFIKKVTEDGSSRTQRQGFCINKEGENRLIIANESIVTKLREDISQKAYKDSKGETFWAFSTPKLTIEITNEEYNALKKFDQSWNKLEDTI